MGIIFQIKKFCISFGGWFGPKHQNTKLVFSFLSALYFVVKMVAFDHMEVPVGRNRCPSKGTGRRKLYATVAT